ncbi:hypothetical protein [Stenotrophomonas geniculata]|uniref:hypothetical protein n=1 Tax=Stenotrophomonas geniculata TaxID=86188 RepID=UPI000307935C|nr:hypothetical protein [Stenotrophomonas geniculata]WNF09039.1 hypothetical protein RKE57_13255 [Stenotrophomonas geniculata]
MSRSVVIYGPHLCGDNANAEELREHFVVMDVLDDLDGHTSYLLDDMLVLTNNADSVAHQSSRVLHQGSAMRQMVAGACA